MKNPDWLKIKEVFYQTLDLPEAEREEFLASCDESIRTEVLELLKSHYEAENFIAEPALIEFGFNEDQLIGGQIDDYEIIKEIGSGRMGKVYLATREGLEKLLEASPNDEIVRYRIAFTEETLGMGYSLLASDKKKNQSLENWKTARDHFQKSYQIYKWSRDEGKTVGTDASVVDKVAEDIAKCDAAISKLQKK